MADAALPVTVRTEESLPAQRTRVMCRIEETRSGIAVEWSEFEQAVAGGERRSLAVVASVCTDMKWALALAALWVLGRRPGRLSWVHAALLAALARAAGKQLVSHWYRGERHVER